MYWLSEFVIFTSQAKIIYNRFKKTKVPGIIQQIGKFHFDRQLDDITTIDIRLDIYIALHSLQRRAWKRGIRV